MSLPPLLLHDAAQFVHVDGRRVTVRNNPLAATTVRIVRGIAVRQFVRAALDPGRLIAQLEAVAVAVIL
jgi:hypothetical protein